MDSAKVLIIAEKKSLLVELVGSLFASKNIKPDLFFLEDGGDLSKLRSQITNQEAYYKTVLIRGLQPLSSQDQQTSKNLIQFFQDNSGLLGNLNIVFGFSSSFELLDQVHDAYQQHLRQQQLFLELVLSALPEAAVFLAQDLLVDSGVPNYPTLLTLGNISQKKILGLEASFGLQDEQSLFDLLGEYLLKPHSAHRFLIVGRRVPVAELNSKITGLYQKYFQKELIHSSLAVSPIRVGLLQDFSRVINAKTSIDALIDSLVRALPRLLGNNLIPFSKVRSVVLIPSTQKTKVSDKKMSAAHHKPPKPAISPSYKHLLQFLSLAKNRVKEQPINDSSKAEQMEGEIERLFEDKRVEEKNDRRDKNTKEVKKIVRKSHKRKILFFVGAVFMAASLILIGALGFYRLSLQKLEQQLFSLMSVRVERGVVRDVVLSESLFWRSTLQFQLDLYGALLDDREAAAAMELASSLDLLQMLKAQEEELVNKLFVLYQEMFGGRVELKPRFDELLSILEKKSQSERQLNSFLTTLNMDLFDGDEKDVWQLALEQNKDAFRKSLLYKQLLEVFSELLLEHGRFNLLIAHQDNRLLRGTGGAINEIMLLSFDERGLTDLRRFNIDDLQRLSYGQQIPSEDLLRLFGDEAQQLIYSNYNSDFTEFAQRFFVLVQETMGLRADTMLFVNSNSEGELLEKLTSIERFSQANLNEFWTLLEQGLSQKEFFFYSAYPRLQQLFDSSLWGGRRIDHQCPTEFAQGQCLVDFIFQSQNNLSAVPSTKIVSQQIHHAIGVGKDLIRHRRQIIFVGDGGGEVALSFLLPSAATIEKLQLNGRTLTSDEGGFEVVERAGYREVLIKTSLSALEKQQVELFIVYVLPNLFDEDFTYTFLEQKQAGQQKKQLTYDIVFDKQLKPQTIAPQARYENKVIRFESDNSDHFVFVVEFKQ